MRALADGKLKAIFPVSPRRRGRRNGRHRSDLQGQAERIAGSKSRAEAQARAGPSAGRRWKASPAISSVASTYRPVGVDGSRSMQTTAQSMTANRERRQCNALPPSARIAKRLQQVGTVAAAAEELSTRLRDLRQVTRSSEIASKAVGDAETHQRHRQVLSTGPEKIGEVVKLIHSIAAQTNLLALNATIEAHVPANPAAALPWSP